MQTMCLAAGLLVTALAGCSTPLGGSVQSGFNEAEIRTAERALERALEDDDPTKWVYSYTEDAVFAAPGAPTVVGRQALLDMARAMKPLSSVRIRTERTEGSGDLAVTFGHASWVNGRPPTAGTTTSVRFTIVWRKAADGRWLVAHEMFNAPPAAR